MAATIRQRAAGSVTESLPVKSSCPGPLTLEGADCQCCAGLVVLHGAAIGTSPLASRHSTEPLDPAVVDCTRNGGGDDDEEAEEEDGTDGKLQFNVVVSLLHQ